LGKKPEKDVRSEARKVASNLGIEKASAGKKWLVFCLTLFVIAGATVIALTMKPAVTITDVGPAPAGGNDAGGISLESPVTLATTPETVIDISSLPAIPEEQGEPQPQGLSIGEGKTHVLVYQDPNCPHCATFEETYGPTLKQWLEAGEITLEHRNVAFLDGNSPSNYSSRASNALACAADKAPASYLGYATAGYAHQPEGEMNNAKLTSLAGEHGATDVEECITDGDFRPFVKYSTLAAQVAQIPGTPSVFVNGAMWDGQTDTDFNLWARGIIEGTTAVG